jgi:hypothetical protein
MPRMSSADNAAVAAKELTHTLLHPAPAAPFATIGDEQLVALKQLALIFEQATSQDIQSKPLLHQGCLIQRPPLTRNFRGCQRLIRTTPACRH